MNHKLFIIAQGTFIAIFLIAIVIFYPRASLELEGNKVSFKAINANVIILSSNPDFSNPRYVDIKENVSFNLRPGVYYWKAGNGIIEGFSEEFKIDSEVGLQILEKKDGEELKNVGNVKVNVTKNKDGSFVGHIILEPEESEKIKEGEYVGRETN
ncbi:MAG: hypothetical protein Q7S27_02410 [Nanoarchaeota archaeon]|nr:hypothetical protein [Nanoarchaeota archaeon]